MADTGGQIELAVAAELAQIDEQTLRELNPGQLRWATAPDRPAQLLVPVGTGAMLEAEATRLSLAERVRWRYYRVRRGDSLSTIARQFGTSVRLLQHANSLRGTLIRTGQRLMIPTSGATQPGLVAVADQDEPPTLDYRVKSGDSLYRIASEYGIAVNDIISWNRLDPRQYLQPGQTLTLYVSR